MNTTTQATKKQEIDWNIVEGSNQDFTDVYPRLQWMHGKRQLQKVGGVVYKGGLFLPADQFPNFSAEGWSEDEFISSQNETIKGYYAPKAYLSIIRIKKYWDDKGSHVHAICCIKGVGGTFSLQVGGISKGQAFMSAFTAHRNQIVAVANRSKPAGAKGIEPLGLWFVLVPEDHDQQVSKVKGESSEVTRPALFTPPEVTLDYVRSLYVGGENYKRFVEIYRETEAWQNQIPKSSVQENADGLDTVSEGVVAQILELCRLKDFPERELALQISNGATTKIEMLTEKEGAGALALLKDY